MEDLETCATSRGRRNALQAEGLDAGSDVVGLT